MNAEELNAEGAKLFEKPRPKATVILFKSSGKYYTETEWEIPTLEEVIANGGHSVDGPTIGPHCMKWSNDFKRVGGNGPVLVVTQEPWGFPHLFPGV